MASTQRRALEQLTWRSDLVAAAWDQALAGLGGHPLQTALWGDARFAVDGIANQRWAAVDSNGCCLLMARIEARAVRGVGKVAWIPRGPAAAPQIPMQQAYRLLLDRLRAEGYLLCIDDPYPERAQAAMAGTPLFPSPRTILIDLTLGRERLMANLQSQWRAGVRAAIRAGVAVEQTRAPGEVARFYAMCDTLSRHKGFALPGSEALMRALCGEEPGPDSEAVLLLARYQGHMAAGALALRCGRSVHYMWGASDRSFAKQRPGEAVQWAVIEWALEHGCHTYDLEGIVPGSNAGVYAFKRKMGGVEVDLPGKQAFPLCVRGAVMLRVARWLKRL